MKKFHEKNVKYLFTWSLSVYLRQMFLVLSQFITFPCVISYNKLNHFVGSEEEVSPADSEENKKR